MENGNSKWNRHWSMEEMIENSENWSLAGDVALLNTIRAYADNLLTKTLTISDNVDDLLNDLNQVGLKLDISQNEFQSLRSSQFIESRVYEDDETVDVKESKEEEKEPTEEDKQKVVRESILGGLSIMDKYFDKIEVSISDSEEDSEQDKSYVLQSKDLYADRPLPLVIGSDEWYKKQHVGLAELSSESDSDRISETYSDSDSEDALPKDLLKGSETSSELDFSSQASENRPVANSTLNDSAKQHDIFESDGSDAGSSLPVKAPISSKNFADQLAEKLGNVISEQQDLSAEINRRPIQPAQSNKFVGDLFSDEPPPLDNLEDTILPKSAQSGLFSGGQGLFDDNEDDSFWGQQNAVPKVKPDANQAVIKQETTTQSQTRNSNLLPKSSQVSKGLFDSDDSTDEDIFEANKKQFSKPPFLQPYKPSVPLFEEEPPVLDSQREKSIKEPTGKKPVGGVPLFGPSNELVDKEIENAVKNQHKNVAKSEEVIKTEQIQRAEGINNEENVQPTKQPLFVDALENNGQNRLRLFDDEDVETPPRKTDIGTKKISLFDDDDDIFKDGLFSNITTKKPALSLFDDIAGDIKDDAGTTKDNSNGTRNNLFSDLDDEKKTRMKTNRENPSKAKQVAGLFSDNEDDDIFQRNLLGSKGVGGETSDVANNDIDCDKNEIDDQDIHGITEKTTEKQETGVGEKLRESEMEKKWLESDSNEYDQSNGLFKAVDVKTIPEKTDVAENKLKTILTSDYAAGPPHLQVTRPTPAPSNVRRQTEERSVSLFGSSPPPDDDDEWDTKSDPFSDTEDQLSYRVDGNGGAPSLFDNEPPSLGPNESSGIVRDQNGTRVDTDDSSFYPYASSSRRLSSDIFSEQQSQDSFFITKNKAESVDVASHLNIIAEGETTSNLNITPSGKMEDLVESKEKESMDSSIQHDVSLEAGRLPIKQTKPLFFLNDDNGNNTDLLSFKTETKNLSKLSEKRLSFLDDADDFLEQGAKSGHSFAKTESSDTLEGSKDGEGGSPKQRGVDGKTQNVWGQFHGDRPKEVSNAGSPGKLKHNLNINVDALLPHRPPPKLKDLSKSHSLDLPKEQDATPTIRPTSRVNLFAPDVLSQPRKLSDINLEKAVSFEDALDNVGVLHSVTKDRVRIPVKRRPSTRRGRREAIRNSTADLSVENERNVGSPPGPSIAIANKMEGVNQPAVGAASQENDLRLTPKETESILRPGNASLKESHVADIFNNDADGDEPHPALSTGRDSKPSRSDRPNSSIFLSGDSDGDLFGPSEVKKPKQEYKGRNKSAAVKKSLFDDSSSDDDLFSASSSSNSTRKDQPNPSARKTQRPSVLRKLENIEADDDPLSSLLK